MGGIDEVDWRSAVEEDRSSTDLAITRTVQGVNQVNFDEFEVKWSEME